MSIDRKSNLQAETLREQHVMAIARIFRKYGYEAASLSVIGKETGLGKSSLYHHFPGGKRDMVGAVLDLAQRFVRDDVMALLKMNAPRRDNVEAFLAYLSDYYDGGRTACLYGVLTLHDAPEDVRRRVGMLTGEWLSMLEADLAARGNPQSKLDSCRILRALQGGLMLTQATGDEACFVQALDDIRELLL